MNIEDKIFTNARLGKHWTEKRAKECLKFFSPTPYRFDPAKERQFQASTVTDYTWNLSERLREGK